MMLFMNKKDTFCLFSRDVIISLCVMKNRFFWKVFHHNQNEIGSKNRSNEKFPQLVNISTTKAWRVACSFQDGHNIGLKWVTTTLKSVKIGYIVVFRNTKSSS